MRVYKILFGNLRLEIEFSSTEYETASVRFLLYRNDTDTLIDEAPGFPIVCLFDVAYVMSLSMRRYGKLIEEENEKNIGGSK